MDKPQYEDAKNGVLEEVEVGARAQVWKHMFAYIETILIKGAVRLRIADHIHDHGGFITLGELANKLPMESVNMSQLHQVMRFMVHMNLFKLVSSPDESVEDRYGLTPVSQLLVRSHERSLAPLVLVEESDAKDLFARWGHMIEGLDGKKYPKTFWEGHYGMPFYEVVEKDPEWNQKMCEGMTSLGKCTVDALVHGLVREKVMDDVTTVVDVGGNTGDVAKVLLRAFPQLKSCIVLELPHVVVESAAAAAEEPKLEFVAGDMFKSIPSADALLLKYMLHSHEDDACIKILRKCKEAILEKKGKVILVEIVLDIEDKPELTYVRYGLGMEMISMGGKERTKKEWANLFHKADFDHYKLIPISALESVVVLY
ncbi:hypothetical protein Sjap_026010 [Stephania japonica]|uniref:O-methyltransferase n=1 Tax=Stephania japonica TaxID=461633 RepID=A0AAP0EAL7_9MAGN|nr:COMT protein [Stephania japonica]